MTELEQIKEQFIVDWANNRYAFRFLFNKYGEEIVRQWIKDDTVIIAADLIAKENEIRFEQFNNLKQSCYDIIVRGSKGEVITDHQLKIAMWVLAGERAFAEAYAKAKGEQKAMSSSKAMGTILNLVDFKDDEPKAN